MVRWKMSGGAKRSIAHVKNVADAAAAISI
jgi:hypothetical protein